MAKRKENQRVLLKVKRPLYALPPVAIDFWDHSAGNVTELDRPIRCQVFGVLYKETDQCYYVASWISDSDLTDHNSEGYCILKSAVIKVIKLG